MRMIVPSASGGVTTGRSVGSRSSLGRNRRRRRLRVPELVERRAGDGMRLRRRAVGKDDGAPLGVVSRDDAARRAHAGGLLRLSMTQAAIVGATGPSPM